MDFILVLHGSKAVRTFTSHLHFSLGAGLSAAAGPVGRVLEADLRAGDRGSGMCYTYSCSKGKNPKRIIFTLRADSFQLPHSSVVNFCLWISPML